MILLYYMVLRTEVHQQHMNKSNIIRIYHSSTYMNVGGVWPDLI